MLVLNAEEHNDSLREVDALKKKAEAAVGAKERLELELTKAAEAKERLQQEAGDHEEQLATVAAAREREVATKLMAAAKAISGKYYISAYFFVLPLLFCAAFLHVFSFFMSQMPQASSLTAVLWSTKLL